MNDIRDPVIRQMVEDFNKASAINLAYHQGRVHRLFLNKLQRMNDQQGGVYQVEPSPPRHPMAKRCQSVLVYIGEWIIRIGLAPIDTPDSPRTRAADEIPPEEVVVVLDTPYTIGPTIPATPPPRAKEE
mgnify:CR=1 FL=1